MPQDNAQAKGLFVRLSAEHHRRLDRAAGALDAPKKDLVAGLVERYVDPDDPERLEALRELTVRRVVIDAGEPGLTVGHHAFRPSAPPEVLDPAQAAELLGVDEATIVELAEAGEIPGRKLGGHWRFARRALLDWLGTAT